MNLNAMIVAGGSSTRMGREKLLAQVRGRSILAHLMSRLEPQVSAVLLNANGDAGRFEHAGIRVLGDLRADIRTPLAGLHAALVHARDNNVDAILTVPSDTPFLPDDLAHRLMSTGCQAAIAASAGQQHYLTGLWSSSLLHHLERAMAQPPLPRLQGWARSCHAVVVEWPAEPYDPFFNVNTPEELALAERLAAEFGL